MRTRRYAWDLDIQGSDDASPLLDGLPRPSRRRRITTPPAAGSDDESGASSCGSGHTTDDSSIGSAPLEDGKQQPKNAQEQQPSQRQRRRAQRGKAALVLGMIRMSDEFMDNYTGPADPLLDLHSARDTWRIRFLEKELKDERMEVVSLADARQLPGVDHVHSGGKHVSCLFESPSLRDLQRALNGRTIGLIVGDYVRFPPDYLRKCYIPVVKVLLPALLRSGLLAADCQVYMPYPRRQAGVANIYAEIENAMIPDRPGAPRLVGPNECALYRATKKLFKEEHMQKTEGLHPDTPFLHFVLGDSVETSRALRGPWW